MTLRYGGGGAGLLQAWLDGVYLGQNVLATGAHDAADHRHGHAHRPGRPAHRRRPRAVGDGPQRLAQRGRRRQRRAEGGARPDLGATRRPPSGGAVARRSRWKIQGNRAARTSPTRPAVRSTTAACTASATAGTCRASPTAAGRRARSPTPRRSPAPPGTARRFTLAIPAGHDASLGLTIGDPTMPRVRRRTTAC